MNYTTTTLLAAAFTAMANVPSAKAANVDLAATTIPATACVPASPAYAAKVRISSGSYRFQYGQAGTAILYCALPKNDVSVVSTLMKVLESYDPDSVLDLPQALPEPGNGMGSYRVYYRDGDGGMFGGNGGVIGAQETRVKTKLISRDMDGIARTVPDSSWTSDSTDVDETQHRRESVTVFAELDANRMYSFQVTLYRANSSASLYFTGIDFHPTNQP